MCSLLVVSNTDWREGSTSHYYVHVYMACSHGYNCKYCYTKVNKSCCRSTACTSSSLFSSQVEGSIWSLKRSVWIYIVTEMKESSTGDMYHEGFFLYIKQQNTEWCKQLTVTHTSTHSHTHTNVWPSWPHTISASPIKLFSFLSPVSSLLIYTTDEGLLVLQLGDRDDTFFSTWVPPLCLCFNYTGLEQLSDDEL